MNIDSMIHVLSRVVVMDKSQILLCKTNKLHPNFYFLPGGHIESGESAIAAAQREFLEETGEKCHIQQFLGCLEHSFRPDNARICHTHEYNFIFLATVDALHGQRHIASQEEAQIQLLWKPLDQIKDLDLRPSALKICMATWLASPVNHVFHSQMLGSLA